MSDVIRLLPDSVANQIAAGEVIQRPASVIKELVENSIDAGATDIQIIVVDSGRTNIQVIDNGKGMSPTDARFCFERHATSKIKSAEDLFSLTTKGFRGEALASVAAVAQVELKTRMEGDELGTHLVISGSKVEKQEVLATSVGSNFAIKNLFFNVPARRKFLKSNHTELSHILTEFERIALVHPEVSFTLHSNGQELFNLTGGNRRQRIVQLFGKKMTQLLPVEAETSLVHVQGFIAKPDSSRKKGAPSFFFVNNRYMRHPYFHKAVMEAYDKLIPVGDQISYFLYLTVSPSDIDVNIHPTKTEIKFENEVPIWQILMAAVKESLGKFECAPRIDFDTEDRPDIPVYLPAGNGLPIEEPKVEYDPGYNPFRSGISSYTSSQRRAGLPWEDLYKNTTPLSGASSAPFSSSVSQDQYINSPHTDYSLAEASSTQSTLYQGTASPVEAGYQPYQLKGRYVLLSVKSGLMLIDQRRAHVRILFDTYLAQLETKQGFSQRLLFPEIIELSPTESAFLKEIEPDLSAIGFDLGDLGSGSYAINATPSGIEGLSPARLVADLLHASMEKGSEIKDQIHYELALTMARSAAIVYGQILTSQEMTKLVDDLFSAKMSNYTPDGKTVYSILKEEEIDRLFR